MTNLVNGIGRNLLIGYKKGVTLLANNNNTNPIKVEIMDNYFQVKRTSGSSDMSTYTNLFITELVESGGDFTESYAVRCAVTCNVRFTRNGNNENTIRLKPNTWTRVSRTVNHSEGLDMVRFGGIYSDDIPLETWLEYKELKLEKGTVATPYQQAPEDMMFPLTWGHIQE